MKRLLQIVIDLLFRLRVDEVIDMFNDTHQKKKNDELRSKFKSLGKNVKLPHGMRLINGQYVSIENSFIALWNLRIEAYDKYGDQSFSPLISIGNNVVMNTDVHIGCINKVIIGNNVLIASRVYISDHSHGEITTDALSFVPAKRLLISKGPVVIEDNVWIGEGVCVLPGVTIGKNAIIGANAVVTKDIPANAVAIGAPARVLKILN